MRTDNRINDKHAGIYKKRTIPAYKILLPLTSLEEARTLLPLAEALTEDRHAQLIILHLVKVPEGEHLSEAATNAIQFRESLSGLMTEERLQPVLTKTMVRSETNIWEGIWENVEQEHIDLMILSSPADSSINTVITEFIDPKLANPPCDLVVVRLTGCVAEKMGWSDVKKVLLPVRGGPYAGLALRIANVIAEKTDATITMLHATRESARSAEKTLLETFSPALYGLERLKRSMTIVDDITAAIATEASDHDVLVMGAPSTRVHADGWGGPIIDEIVDRTNLTLVIVKRKLDIQELGNTQADMSIQEQKKAIGERYLGDRPIAVVVDQWFAENTYHSREFKDFERLLFLKEAQGAKISLGLPALNEADTVGNVITTLKNTLMDKIPLVDEMILIDSGSVDYTRDIAIDLGIPVYIHHDILPQYGAYHGKGEALWKSLYVLSGDIIAWVDTDIKNIHPRFVYGLLGPLLKDASLQYVKGFYRRPLRDGEKLIAGGGGRVTELTARPLINLFFPELSGIIQPLSGEYTGRRSALEQLPFFTGYGVETGLLLDLLDQFGLQAIAQVDLLERVHHNQPLPSLSKMSFAILQVVINRLEKLHRADLLKDTNLTMNLIRYRPSRYFLEMEEIQEFERPPMITISEYKQKFQA